MNLEAILTRANVGLAYYKVVSNKGAPGIDDMKVEELGDYLKSNWQSLRELIKSGQYRPKAVRRVSIPKPDGGERHLGIPTALDRMIQQAISQQLMLYYDPTFSEHSYGFRPGRSAHQALDAALSHLNNGYEYVVEVDLEKFFDRVNHDRLMQRLSESITDKELLRLIRRYLQSGVMINGILNRTEEGTPQGGNLSPLLSNIVLDELDKELENRGHKFVRYADDIGIYVKSRKAGERVLSSITTWIEKKLKLRVNRDKSGVKHYKESGLLGFGFHRYKEKIEARISGKSYQRFKAKLKRLTKKTWSISMDERLIRINQLTQGWLFYFGKANGKWRLQRLDHWLGRRLRACIWKQWKLPKTRYRNLMKLGVNADLAYAWANTRKGCWRVAGGQAMGIAVTNARLKKKGYKSLLESYTGIHSYLMNRRDTGTVRPVV